MKRNYSPYGRYRYPHVSHQPCVSGTQVARARLGCQGLSNLAMIRICWQGLNIAKALRGATHLPKEEFFHSLQLRIGLVLHVLIYPECLIGLSPNCRQVNSHLTLKHQVSVDMRHRVNTPFAECIAESLDASLAHLAILRLVLLGSKSIHLFMGRSTRTETSTDNFPSKKHLLPLEIQQLLQYL
jgi:hypothetical protein